MGTKRSHERGSGGKCAPGGDRRGSPRSPPYSLRLSAPHLPSRPEKPPHFSPRRHGEHGGRCCLASVHLAPPRDRHERRGCSSSPPQSTGLREPSHRGGQSGGERVWEHRRYAPIELGHNGRQPYVVFCENCSAGRPEPRVDTSGDSGMTHMGALHVPYSSPGHNSCSVRCSRWLAHRLRPSLLCCLGGRVAPARRSRQHGRSRLLRSSPRKREVCSV